MSVNTARMLSSFFSNPAWKLLLIAAVLAFIGCFIIKGKKRVIPIIACIVSVGLFLVTGVISSSANNVIVHQAGTDPEKISGNADRRGSFSALINDDTIQWSDKPDEYMRDRVTDGERYLNRGQAGSGSQNNNADDSSIVTPDVSCVDEGIDYDYWLRLDKTPGEYYEVDVDDTNYKLTDYSKYITVYITNNGTEDAYAGGEYHLQRLVNGAYTDIEDDMNLIYAGVDVQDMPLIVLHDEADGSEIPLADETDLFVIKPGQTIKAEFLTMRYRILEFPEYAGEYRFLYGDVAIDFELYCDTIS